MEKVITLSSRAAATDSSVLPALLPRLSDGMVNHQSGGKAREYCRPVFIA